MWNSRAARALLAAGIGILLGLAPVRSAAQGPLQSATITEHLGAALPAALTFTDDGGHTITLDSLLGGKPLVISLAYFSCPMLCPLGQDGAADGFRASGWQLGRDFRAVTISIDPRDRPSVAHAWRERVAGRLGVPASAVDWPFLVGDEPNIRRLADAVGFQYSYDEASGQYSHAAALFVVGADGRVSRYVYGIAFDPADLAGALTAAGANRRVSSLETVILRCFHYVPALRQHGGFVVWLLRIGGLTVTAAMVSMLLVLWRREART
jgi:protein SCO1/2